MKTLQSAEEIREAVDAKLGKARIRHVAEALAEANNMGADRWKAHADNARTALMADAAYRFKLLVEADSDASADTGPSPAAAPVVITDEMVRRANGVDGAGIGLAVTRRMLEAALAPEPTPLAFAVEAACKHLRASEKLSNIEAAVQAAIDAYLKATAASGPTPPCVDSDELFTQANPPGSTPTVVRYIGPLLGSFVRTAQALADAHPACGEFNDLHVVSWRHDGSPKGYSAIAKEIEKRLHSRGVQP